MSETIDLTQERGRREMDEHAKIIGPFAPQWGLVVDGYEVPHITLCPVDDAPGQYNVILDDRLCLMASKEEIQKWALFLANAMAHAAGYTHFGEGSHLNHRLYSKRVLEITSVETE